VGQGRSGVGDEKSNERVDVGLEVMEEKSDNIGGGGGE